MFKLRDETENDERDKMKTKQELEEEIKYLQRRNSELEAESLRHAASHALGGDDDVQYSAVIESAPNAIITADDRGKIISWNKAAENIFGYCAEEAIGEPLTFIIPERFRKDHLNTRKRMLEGREPNTGKISEVIGLRKDGTEFPLELSLAKWKFGESRFFTEIIHDITERKRMDNQLIDKHNEIQKINDDLRKSFEQETKLREHLVKAERFASIGEMGAKIAHEINNPLTVIMGQAQVQLTKKIDPGIAESLKMIVEKATEVANLTRNYMNLGKPIDAKMEKINLGRVIHNSVKSLSGLGQLKNVSISESYVDQKIEIIGDAGKIEQVFRNLLINAIHALENRPNAEIKIKTLISNDGKGVTAYVEDNGIGIDPNNLNKIFDHYYSTKKDGIGTGLGLVISKEIVEGLHGGKIAVNSTKGSGTTFSVFIPREYQTKQKKKILIIDDNAYITDLYSEYLSRKGFLIRATNRSKDALKIFNSFNPDLVLCDVDMPELTGFDILKQIEEIDPIQHFVMITGAFLSIEELSLLKRKKITYLIKPADLEKELLEIVRNKLFGQDEITAKKVTNSDNFRVAELA